MTRYQQVVDLWQGFKIESEADLEAHLDSFKILFAYNSNKMENANTTYDDTYQVFERGKVSSYTGDVRTLIEIQNQKEATVAWSRRSSTESRWTSRWSWSIRG